MKDNISPEEKLLRLIRGQKKEERPIAKAAEEKPYSIPPLYSSIKRYFSIFYFRKFIFLILSASCAYLVISLIYPWLGLKKINLPKASNERILDSSKETVPEAKPVEFYLEGLKNRQIFNSPATGEASKPLAAVNTELVNNLNLIGIISGDNPQAIVEDKKTQKTFYLNKGQFIEEFQLEDIQEGKIILIYNSQRYELHL